MKFGNFFLVIFFSIVLALIFAGVMAITGNDPKYWWAVACVTYISLTSMLAYTEDK